MRFNDFKLSDPVEELANKLPALKRIDYDAIDELMQKICHKHKLSGEKLHDLFVKKYRSTPDNWVKKIKQRNEEQVNESVDSDKDLARLHHFVDWSMKVLHVKSKPKFKFSRDTNQAQQGHHTGLHNGDEIWVYIENRNLVDIFRTVFHELVHQRQEELNMIKPGDSYPGSPIEAMADMLAGKYIKIYGKEHRDIFQ